MGMEDIVGPIRLKQMVIGVVMGVVMGAGAGKSTGMEEGKITAGQGGMLAQGEAHD